MVFYCGGAGLRRVQQDCVEAAGAFAVEYFDPHRPQSLDFNFLVLMQVIQKTGEAEEVLE